MSAKRYSWDGVRTYQEMQRDLNGSVGKWVDVDISDEIYDGFPHPRPQTLHEYNQTLRTSGTITEIPKEPRKIKIEMEHSWKEGHSWQERHNRKDKNSYPKDNNPYLKQENKGVTGTDLELMFIFGFGGCFACWMFIMMIQIFMNKVVL